jgi:hypothetical protein
MGFDDENENLADLTIKHYETMEFKHEHMGFNY